MKIYFPSPTESNLFSHGAALAEMHRPSGVSSQAEPYYSPNVPMSGALPHHPSAIPAMVPQSSSSWSSMVHPTSCSVNTNPLSSFSTGTLSSNSQGIPPFLEMPLELNASNPCLYNSTNNIGRMEASPMSSADLYSISGDNMLPNCHMNMMTPSNDSLRETDNSRLTSMNIESPSCNSGLDPRDLRQLHQMSSSSLSAGASSSATAFVSQSDAFEGSNFNRTSNSMINESGSSNGTNANSHGFVQSQYSGIGTIQNEQLSSSFELDFFPS